MTSIPDGDNLRNTVATLSILRVKMKRLLREGTTPLKLPYDVVLQGIYSLVIPICNTEERKTTTYLQNFCFQSTFKSNISFDLHYQPHKGVKAGTDCPSTKEEN